jgi:hypothetical protein
MTEQVCQTYSASSKENCNDCLLSECGDCLDACYDTSSCPDTFAFHKDIKIGEPNATHSVSKNDIITGFSSYPEGLVGISGGGEKYVCKLDNAAVPKEIKIGDSGPFQNIEGSEHATDTFTLAARNLHKESDTSSGFYVSGSHVEAQGSPTVPVGDDIFVKGLFTGKKSSKSFEYIQDLYSDNFKKYKEFYDQHPELPPLDIDFYSLRNVDEDSLAVNMFNLVKNMYNINTFDSKSLQLDKNATNKELGSLLGQIEEKRAVIHELKEMNSTNKRNIEININKTRRLKDTNNVLMIVMIVVAVLILFPLLSKANMMSRSTGIVIWCVALLGVLFYMAYELYYKSINRDETDYKRYMFAKPSDREIAKSRASAQLSDKDKARCQAFSELEDELDAPKINLDVSEYYSRTDQVDQCSNLD